MTVTEKDRERAREVMNDLIHGAGEDAVATALAQARAEERDELYAHFTEVAIDAVKRAAAIRAGGTR